MMYVVAPGPPAPAPPGGFQPHGAGGFDLAVFAAAFLAAGVGLLVYRKKKSRTLFHRVVNQPEPEPGDVRTAENHSQIVYARSIQSVSTPSPKQLDFGSVVDTGIADQAVVAERRTQAVVICYKGDEAAAADRSIQEWQTRFPDKVEEVKARLIQVVHRQGASLRGSSLERDRSPSRVKVSPSDETFFKVLESQKDPNGFTCFRIKHDKWDSSADSWIAEKTDTSKGRQEVCKLVDPVKVVHPRGTNIRDASLQRIDSPKRGGSLGKAKLQEGFIFERRGQKIENDVRFFKVSEDGWVPEWHVSNGTPQRVCEVAVESQLPAWPDIERVLAKGRVALVKRLIGEDLEDVQAVQASAAKEDASYARARFVSLQSLEGVVQQLVE